VRKDSTKLMRKIMCLVLSTVLVFGLFINVSYGMGADIDPLQKVILKAIDLDKKAKSDFVKEVLEKVNKGNYADYVDDTRTILKLDIVDADIEAALKSFAYYPDTYKKKVLTSIKGFNLPEIGKKYDLSKFWGIASIINFEVTGDYYDNEGIRLFLYIFDTLNTVTGKNAFYDDATNKFKLDIKIENPHLTSELDDLIKLVQSLNMRGITTFEGFVNYVEGVVNAHPNIEIYNFKKFLKDEKVGYAGTLPVPDNSDISISPLQKVILEVIDLEDAKRREFVDEVLSKVTKTDYSTYVAAAKEYLGFTMSDQDITEALKAYANYPKAHKDKVEKAIKTIKLDNKKYKTDDFIDIFRRINFEFTGDYTNDKGFRLFVKVLDFLKTFTGNTIFDDATDKYKVDIKVDGNATLKAQLDILIQSIESLTDRGIDSFDKFVVEAEAIINSHSNEQIFNFKKFMKDEKLGYGGSLPNPNPGPSNPGGPRPGGPGGTTGGGSAATPNPTPTPAVTEPVVTNVPGANPFSDLPDTHWAKDNILELVAKKIIAGYTDGTVRPDAQITRAEMAVVIVKSIGLEPVETPDLKFKDAKDIASWAAGYVQTAVEKNIIVGYEDNTFRPANKMTREEMVVMVLKAYMYEVSENAELSFTDKADVGSWSAGYVAKAVELGFVKGYPDNTFKPKNNVTRAEAATVIVKCLKAAEEKAKEQPTE